jgi:glycosyltransferase involved in cell wall biosynthesis
MPNKRHRILAIVPALNEEGSIRKVVEEILEIRPRIDVVVIDDGSTDSTARQARSAGAEVIVLPFNLGIGGAVQTGFRYAEAKKYEIAVQVDGDGQHRPDQIPVLLDVLEKENADVTIGSRFIEARGYTTSRIRHVGVRVFFLVNSLLLGKRITDNTSGFRAYNRKTIEFFAKHYPQDYPEPESVVILALNGFRIAETSVTMREREHGHSSISAFRAVYYMIKVLLAIFMDLFKEKIS